MNAVAPDWNLKTFQAAFEERGIEECSRTRLEFKGINASARSASFLNAVAPDWNLKMVTTTGMKDNAINAVAPDWNLKVIIPRLDGHTDRMQSHQIGI